MTFIFQNFEIPSASMVKTLLIGDHVLVDRIALAPPAHWAPFVFYREVKRGDIIVFLKPGYPDLFLVKRAIGIPGDRVHMRNGIVYLNGIAQDEPQAGKPVNDDNPQHAYNAYRDDFPSIPPGPMDDVTATWQYDLPKYIQGEDLVVPPGKIFAMGDNRTRKPRRPLLGLRSARKHRRPPHVRLLVVRDPRRSDRQAEHRGAHQLHGPHPHPCLRPDTLETHPASYSIARQPAQAVDK